MEHKTNSKDLAKFISTELMEFCGEVSVTPEQIAKTPNLRYFISRKYQTKKTGSESVSEAEMAAETLYQRLEDEYSLEISEEDKKTLLRGNVESICDYINSRVNTQ